MSKLLRAGLLAPVFTLLLNSQPQTAGAQNRALTYPETRKGPETDTYFGTQVADPYRWLEDDRSPETADWVKRQNAVTFGFLDQIPYRQKINERITQLYNYEKYGSPTREGNWIYYFKNNGLQNQSVMYRQPVKGGNSEVFLDPNTFSKDGTTSIGGLDFSHDGSLVAFQISEGGSDWRKMIIMRADNRQIIDDTIQDIKFSGIAWHGNQGIYYSRYDRPANGSVLSARTNEHKVYYHKLGTRASEDKVVFGAPQLIRRYIGASVTEDQQHLVITAANATYGNELYVQDLSKPNAPIVPVVTGFETEQHVVHAEKGQLYIITNLNAPNKRLVVAPAANPTPQNWKTLIAETEFPLSVSSVGGKIFASYLKDAVSVVYQYDLNGKREREIKLPGLGSAGGFDGKRNDKVTYYSFTSYNYPNTIFQLDLATGQSTVYKKPAVQFDPAAYESKQVFYNSKDGTRIPMIITHKKGIKLDGSNPTLLYAYGGFNVSLTPAFSVSNLALMEQGGIYAVANLRGGGEYGDKWHNAGIKTVKQNVFDDFIAAAEYLIAQKYTSQKRLAIFGGSNGGLLVGACMTQRPDLFGVCFPAVGVLDMLRYHKFTAGAGWAYDYGTAEDSKEMFDYLHRYSPVHAVKQGQCYPPTMISTADHDDRVVPAHSFKYAAALQAAQSCSNPTLIRIETKAGHGAGRSTRQIISDAADRLAFMYYNMGLTWK